MARSETNILPIGLDLGYHDANLVQVAVDHGTVKVIAKATIPIPESLQADRVSRMEYLVRQIPLALKSAPFVGRQCVLAMPSEEVFIRHVRVRRLDPRAREMVVRKSLQNELPFPVENAVLRHVVVREITGQGDPMHEILVMAAPLQIMTVYLNAVKRAKLDPVRVSLRCEAITKCFSGLAHWGQTTERPLVYIDLDSSLMGVAIAGGSQMLFARNLEQGVVDLDKAIAEEVNSTVFDAWQTRMRLQMEEATAVEEQAVAYCFTPWLEVVTEQLAQCVRYYQNVFRDERTPLIVFTGEQVRDLRLCEVLSHQMDLPAQIGTLAGVDVTAADPNEECCPRPGLAVAIGLSLLGDEGVSHETNMIPPQFLSEVNRKRMDRFCVGLFLAVMVGVIVADRISYEKYRPTLNVYNAMQSQFAEGAEFTRSYLDRLSKKNQLLKRARDLTALEESIPRSYIIGSLANLRPAGLGVDYLDMSYQPKSQAPGVILTKSSDDAGPKKVEPVVNVVWLEMSGLAQSDAEVEQFVDALKNSPIVQSVDLKYTAAATFDNVPCRRYQIRVELKEGNLEELLKNRPVNYASTQPASSPATQPTMPEPASAAPQPASRSVSAASLPATQP